ncbi:hypothetical protein [Streptomyces cavernae]|uniref:hypothetical protein n=1 Tax=Streptomyces cavernae TaxID=2259034 RepID=UPI000FEC044E|nr:hypothetical protein [Streptomyces cavernae]
MAGLIAWGLVVVADRTETLLPGWRILAFFLAMVVVFQGLMAVGVFGVKAAFSAAVPLADPDTILAGGRRGLRHFGPRYGAFFVLEAVLYSVIAFFVVDARIVLLFFSVIPFLRAGWTAWWERRHEMLVWEAWQGEVRQSRQPVTRKGKKPMHVLYTTPSRVNRSRVPAG